MNEIAVRCKGLTKRYGQTVAVQGADLELEKGSILALLGPSGCGKTTLLRLLAGFEVASEGTITVGGRVVAGAGVFVPPEKRRVGIVFQDYALFPHLDVAANIAYGLSRDTDRRGRVREMLSLVGLKGLGERMPHQLSGGQQQRVALARALAPSPEVLLLDEPFSSLDADLRARVRAEVKGILACAQATAVFVTHDQEEALYMGDRVGVMGNGRLEQVDTPERVFHEPTSLFVAHFMGTADFLDGDGRGSGVDTEIGNLRLPVGMSASGAVKVMVRPEAVDLRPAPTGLGVVVERVFQGMHYVYRVRLPSGATLRSRQPYGRSLAIGSNVEIMLDVGQPLVCFAGDRRVGPAQADRALVGTASGLHRP